MTILEYVQEECDRQGHAAGTFDGATRSLWMMNAWREAQVQYQPELMPTLEQVIHWGTLVEPGMNEHGTRTHRVQVGMRLCPSVHEIKPMLEGLWTGIGDMPVLDAYRAFEEIHPFGDGNGRTGKILLNWLNHTLHDPIFPPCRLLGQED